MSVNFSQFNTWHTHYLISHTLSQSLKKKKRHNDSISELSVKCFKKTFIKKTCYLFLFKHHIQKVKAQIYNDVTALKSTEYFVSVCDKQKQSQK